MEIATIAHIAKWDRDETFLSPPPYADAPVVVLISGLGGSGSYWLPQLAVLDQEYQVVCYDQRGTGNNPDTLAEDYSIAQMAAELHQALVAAGIERYAVVGHALGALVGMQLALDYPASVTVLVSVNGWLRINAHTRRCFQVREQLLHSGGAQAWVEAQPLFLYPADWMAARAPRLEAEGALALAHFQGKIIYCVDLTPSNALTLVAMRIVSAARCKSSAPVMICWCHQHVPVNFMPLCPIARKW